MRENKIIGYGQDLDEEFLDLMIVSQSWDDYILISKLKNILTDLKDNVYFSRFGTLPRTEAEISNTQSHSKFNFLHKYRCSSSADTTYQAKSTRRDNRQRHYKNWYELRRVQRFNSRSW